MYEGLSTRKSNSSWWCSSSLMDNGVFSIYSPTMASRSGLSRFRCSAVMVVCILPGLSPTVTNGLPLIRCRTVAWSWLESGLLLLSNQLRKLYYYVKKNLTQHGSSYCCIKTIVDHCRSTPRLKLCQPGAPAAPVSRRFHSIGVYRERLPYQTFLALT